MDLQDEQECHLAVTTNSMVVLGFFVVFFFKYKFLLCKTKSLVLLLVAGL